MSFTDRCFPLRTLAQRESGGGRVGAPQHTSFGGLSTKSRSFSAATRGSTSPSASTEECRCTTHAIAAVTGHDASGPRSPSKVRAVRRARSGPALAAGGGSAFQPRILFGSPGCRRQALGAPASLISSGNFPPLAQSQADLRRPPCKRACQQPRNNGGEGSRPVIYKGFF